MSINYLPIDNEIALTTSAVTDALTGDPITDASITAAVLTVGDVSLCSASLTHDTGGIYKGTLDLSTASTDLALNTHYYLQLSASNYALVWKRLLRAEDRPLVGNGSVSIDITPSTSGLPNVTGIPKGDGSGTYSAATVGTDYAKPGSVVIYHKAGTQTTYPASASTDAARGTALKTAVAAAVDTDVVILGAGTYDIGNNTLDLSVGGTGSVHLRGFSRAASIINHQCSFATHGAAVHPGDSSVVSRLTITATTDINADFEVGWGRGYPSSATPQSAFTQAVLQDVLIIGRTDCIIVEGNTDICSADIINCDFQSNWDCFGISGGIVAGSTFTRRNCRFFTDGTNSGASGAARCTHTQSPCTINDYDCEYRAINAAGSPSSTVGIETTGGVIVKLSGGRFETSASSGNVYDINKLSASSGASFKISGGTSYTPSKVNAIGGILGLSGSSPRVLFTASAQVAVAATNTFTTLIGAGVGSVTLPANFFTVGKTVWIKAGGYCGSSQTGQQAFRIRIGSTNIAFSVLTPQAAGSSGGLASNWAMEVMITCYATGSSATLMSNGKVRVGDVALDLPTLGQIETVGDLSLQTASNIDTTAAQALDIQVKHGASTTVDDTTKLTNLFVMELN